MYKYLIIPLLLLITNVIDAQNRASVKGTVIDSASKSPVELATVAVLRQRDTTSELVSYTVTDKTGHFTLRNLPNNIPLKILITYVSYNPFRKNFTLKNNETLDLNTISLGSAQLKEVVIRGEVVPVTIRKDTVEFSTEAFKTRPNAVVEDLLKKLPGIEVDGQGNIFFNGKQVNKVLVDGHEYFVNDPRIATKNLDADMVAKVQVYDDRENDPDHLQPDLEVKKIINLKFKKAYKKSIFGKAYAGAGTQSRYNLGGLLNMFRDTLQVSVLGLKNNLNNTGFSFSDLYTSGGLNRGGGETLSRATNFGGLGNGIQDQLSGGLNINTDYGKKLKINLAYYYSDNTTTNNTLNTRQQLLVDTNFTTNTATTRLQHQINNTVSAGVTWRPDDKTQINYNPSFSYGTNNSASTTTANSFSNVIANINQSNTNANNFGNNLQLSQSFNYNRQLSKPGSSITISHSLQIGSNTTNNYDINSVTSFTSAVPSFLLNRYTNDNTKSANVSIGVAYQYPISKKLSSNINFTDNYSHQVYNTDVFDYNPATNSYTSFLQLPSTDLTRNQWTHSVNTSVRYNVKQNLALSVNLNTQYLNINNQFGRNTADLDQKYFSLLPGASISISRFSLYYQNSFVLPNIGDMIPYSIVYSPLYSVVGNPDLKPLKRNTYSLSYNNYTPSQMNINAGINASFDNNGVFRVRTLNAVGVETSTPINMNGRYTLSANGSISKRFKKQNDISFNESSNLNFSKYHNFFEFNHQDGYQDTYNLSFTQSLSFNWKDIIEIDPSYMLNHSFTSYTGVNYNNVVYTTHVVGSHFNIYWPKKINVEGTYSYAYNPMVGPGFQKSTNLLNLSIARALLSKDRDEIKISCYDILNQNISSIRTINENTINDTQSKILKRYFLLTLQYNFRKSLTK